MATAKSNGTSGDKPAAPDLNLDSLEREGEFRPFTFILDGRRYQTVDLEGKDWQELMDLDDAANRGDARTMMKTMLSEDDWDAFSKVHLPMWKFTKLAQEVYEYVSAQTGDKGEDNASVGT
ncbi:MAG TPA: hypothetical protein VK053_19260 [Jiangellaceae bacterium]|nr:hypothetical protein [Jiangellaceae bacterium]